MKHLRQRSNLEDQLGRSVQHHDTTKSFGSGRELARPFKYPMSSSESDTVSQYVLKGRREDRYPMPNQPRIQQSTPRRRANHHSYIGEKVTDP